MCGEEQYVKKIWLGNLERRKSVISKMVPEEIGWEGVDWINLAVGRENWRSPEYSN